MRTKKIRLKLALLPVLTTLVGLLSFACATETTIKTEDHLQTAAGFVSEGDFDSAVSEYDAAIAFNPNSDTAYEGRGVAYREMGDYDQAIRDLTKAIEIAPSRSGPYYERGVAYRLRGEQGDLDKAISDLSRAIGIRATTRFRRALIH